MSALRSFKGQNSSALKYDKGDKMLLGSLTKLGER